MEETTSKTPPLQSLQSPRQHHHQQQQQQLQQKQKRAGGLFRLLKTPPMVVATSSSSSNSNYRSRMERTLSFKNFSRTVLGRNDDSDSHDDDDTSVSVNYLEEPDPIIPALHSQQQQQQQQQQPQPQQQQHLQNRRNMYTSSPSIRSLQIAERDGGDCCNRDEGNPSLEESLEQSTTTATATTTKNNTKNNVMTTPHLERTNSFKRRGTLSRSNSHGRLSLTMRSNSFKRIGIGKRIGKGMEMVRSQSPPPPGRSRTPTIPASTYSLTNTNTNTNTNILTNDAAPPPTAAIIGNATIFYNDDNNTEPNWLDEQTLPLPTNKYNTKLKHMDLDKMEAQGDVLPSSTTTTTTTNTTTNSSSSSSSTCHKQQQNTPITSLLDSAGNHDNDNDETDWDAPRETFMDEIGSYYSNEIPNMAPATDRNNNNKRSNNNNKNKRQQFQRVNSVLFANRKDFSYVDQSTNLMDCSNSRADDAQQITSSSSSRRHHRSHDRKRLASFNATAGGTFSKSTMTSSLPMINHRCKLCLFFILILVGVSCVVYFAMPDTVTRVEPSKSSAAAAAAAAAAADYDDNDNDKAITEASATTVEPQPQPQPTTEALNNVDNAPPIQSYVVSSTEEASHNQNSLSLDGLTQELNLMLKNNNLNNSSHPAFYAATWIVKTDPVKFDATTNKVQVSTRFALATLYYATHPNLAPFHSVGKPIPDPTLTKDETWVREDGWMSKDSVCSWYGIECQNLVVTKLDLSNNHVGGDLPFNELSILNQLTFLDLSSNQKLKGTLSDAPISSWSKMQYLLLHENQWEGTLTTVLGSLTSLQDLSLWGNNLIGNIPDLSALTDLRTFTINLCVKNKRTAVSCTQIISFLFMLSLV